VSTFTVGFGRRIFSSWAFRRGAQTSKVAERLMSYKTDLLKARSTTKDKLAFRLDEPFAIPMTSRSQAIFRRGPGPI